MKTTLYPNYIDSGAAIVWHRRTLLERHLRTHDEEKQFACAVCGKRFSTEKMLTRHRHVHDAKSFHCDVCEKLFSSKTMLTLHVRMVKILH
ncbi:hypothetical protein LSTR_LSTR017545 [Laodelphax striatellus]|uniref:C2H2-type domain-containing protein n=1 Tax=Laodelphax striatellus TaxID=195883 RepID=A0A482WKT3_LAOST|nr:hypothetical protein LSTR_LSTR017545 [Laodelphax striatellus]